MKYGIIAALALSTLLAGATCLPLFDLSPTDDVSADVPTIGVSVLEPDNDQTVKQGDLVIIEWSASNLSDETVTATVYVRSTADLSQTILEGGVRIAQSPGKQSLYWDTGSTVSDFSGEYTVHVKLEAGAKTASDEAAGKITVNSAPFFQFTAPTTDVTLEKGDPEDPDDPNSPLTAAEITISWNSSDADSDGVAAIGLDPDSADLSHDSGNEITIYEAAIPRTLGVDSIDWDGNDTSGESVPAGAYTLYARVTDDVNDEAIVDALVKSKNPVRISVPEAVSAAITVPDEDVSIVYGDNEKLAIRYTLDEDTDVIVDFRVDPDDNHDNGNETTIVSRLSIPKGTTSDIFKWDGYYAATETKSLIVGADGKGGYFRMLMIIDRGKATVDTVESGHFFFVRETDESPVIALIEPKIDVTLTAGAGGSFLIKWRDDDPSETAKIRLVLDDDATPNEGVNETDDAETVLTSADFDDISADEDGLGDTHRYYVRDDLAADRYWIFAYIDRDGAAPWDNIAVAAGQLVIEDPDAAP